MLILFLVTNDDFAGNMVELYWFSELTGLSVEFGLIKNLQEENNEYYDENTGRFTYW